MPQTAAAVAIAVVIEPYCVRIFKQLWYVIGSNVKDKKIKTYAPLGELSRTRRAYARRSTCNKSNHSAKVQLFSDIRKRKCKKYHLNNFLTNS